MAHSQRTFVPLPLIPSFLASWSQQSDNLYLAVTPWLRCTVVMQNVAVLPACSVIIREEISQPTCRKSFKVMAKKWVLIVYYICSALAVFQVNFNRPIIGQKTQVCDKWCDNWIYYPIRGVAYKLSYYVLWWLCQHYNDISFQCLSQIPQWYWWGRWHSVCTLLLAQVMTQPSRFKNYATHDKVKLFAVVFAGREQVGLHQARTDFKISCLIEWHI